MSLFTEVWNGGRALRAHKTKATMRHSAGVGRLAPSLAVCLAMLAVCQFPAPAAEQVAIQLKWYHQYQFAGYYAADMRGYYRDAGLDVRIVEGSAQRPAIEEISDGRAQYGVAGPEFLVARDRGKPVMVLAAIYQHSPVVFMTRASAGVRSLADLPGKTVMMSEDAGSAPLTLLLRREGIPPGAIRFVPLDWNWQGFDSGDVAAVSAYLTDLHWFARELIEPGIIDPADYGIDFYGDCLLTSEAEWLRHRQRALDFRQASLEGWRYAMLHFDEVADYILGLPTERADRLTRRDLRAEYQAIKDLVLPEVVEIGHMNPDRWRRIAENYKELGLVDKTPDPEDFMAVPDDGSRALRWVYLAGGVVIGALALSLIAFAWQAQLRAQVRQRTEELTSEIARRRRAQEALTESERRHRIVADFTYDWEWWRGPNGRFLYVSPSCERITGRGPEEFMESPGILIDKVAHPEDREALREHLSQETRDDAGEALDFRICMPDGTIRHVAHRCAPVYDEDGRYLGRRGSNRDITDRVDVQQALRRTEERLSRVEKARSLNVMAGAVAHHFNNQLQTVLGNLDLLRLDLPGDSETQGMLTDIEDAARRAADISTQMLTYVGQEQRSIVEIDLCELVRSVRDALQTRAGTVALSLELADGPLPLHADPLQLRTILENLVANAREAIEDDDGLIRIVTRKSRLTPDDVAQLIGTETLAAGEYAIMEVIDDGPGMDAAVRERAFDPFFTTHFAGRGMGLATVLGTVRAHGGAVALESEPGAGCAVRVYLPLVGIPREASGAHDRVVDRADTQGFVLLVDDEMGVLDTARRMLERFGYAVMVAQDGAEAVARVQEAGDAMSCVVMDLVMPRMGGEKAFDAIREIYPDLPIVMTSGYSADEVRRRMARRTPEALLHKPFRFDDLTRTMQRVLRERLDRANRKTP